MSKARVILIGEMHELKEDVRSRKMSSVGILHNYIEKKITQYLIAQAQDKIKYPNGINVMFVNEGQDPNERNNNIIKSIFKAGITNELSRISEFSKAVMEKNNYKISYFATGVLSFLKTIDHYKTDPSYKYDIQYNCPVNETYFLKLFLSHKLENLFTKYTHDECIIQLIKIACGSLLGDYTLAYNQVVNKFIQLISQYEDSQYSVSHLFVPLIESSPDERIGFSGLNNTIMEQLRCFRDSNLISRINIGLERKPVDFIVFYFGLNHYSNQRKLIEQSEFMELDELGFKMDSEFLSQASNPSSPIHEEIFSEFFSTVSLGK